MWITIRATPKNVTAYDLQSTMKALRLLQVFSSYYFVLCAFGGWFEAVTTCKCSDSGSTARSQPISIC
jgi:hypothetical protein